MKRVIFIFVFMFIFGTSVYADKRYDYITDTSIYINGDKVEKLNDNNYYTYVDINMNDTIELYSPKPISSAYIIYSLKAKAGNLSYSDNWQLVGEKGFLHEYIPLDGKTKTFDLTYKEDVTIKEIFVFDGDTPDWVEKWERPCEDADILLFSAHSDDEHLFFAGLIPKMVDDGKKIQVAYFTLHDNNPIRFDESLNGLWAAGLRNYPVYGIVKDKYAWTLKEAISNLKKTGLTMDDAISYEVDMIRRFKPEIVVSHDENGEYGHGQHRLTTYTLKEALKYVNDINYKSTYEPFEPYKVYLHLYEENQIIMDYDIPLSSFGGKTAFRVSMNAFAKHETQQHILYGKWQKLDKATEIKQYSPLYYGLYYSTVGYENKDNDMFYNIPQQVISLEKEPEENVTTTTKDEFKRIDDRDNKIKSIFMIIIVLFIGLDILAVIINKNIK